MVGLNGSELTFFRKLTTETDNFFHGKFVFTNAGCTVSKFAQPISPIGTNEYEFEFKTPDWLPPSTIYSAEYCSSNFKIRYALWA